MLLSTLALTIANNSMLSSRKVSQKHSAFALRLALKKLAKPTKTTIEQSAAA